MQNVLVIEDHEVTREWLVGLAQDVFPTSSIHQSGTLEQAYSWLSDNSAHLAIVDLSLPDGSGTDLLRHFKLHSPDTYLVVATIFDDDKHLFEALRAGANGYLLKDQSSKAIIDSLSGIAAGSPPLSPAVSRRLLRQFQQPKDNEGAVALSEREKEVLFLLAKGFGRSDIAEFLGVSVNTVASHIKAIYRKLNVSGRAEATLEAVRMGLIPGI
ncbi:response regulator transcription factor [Marinobacter sediminicola]|uniref:response regulator transcription factor n=1 Tax=Marinobacter sediminicola TaxID=3072994 RepID=UPI0028112602|nr:response regulator transcription factor [Marinobacter sp. F26243]